MLDVGVGERAELPDGDVGLGLDASASAYVIFTSGSTGEPKGALISHRGMLNHLWAKVADLDLTAEDVVAQIATATFDVHVWQFLSPLLVAGRTAIFEGDDAWEPRRLLTRLGRDGATIVETVPSHLQLVLEVLEHEPLLAADLDALRVMMLNGEPLPVEQTTRWQARVPGAAIVNAYGATETSDDVTHFHLHGDPPAGWTSVAISGTLPNLGVYVLDPWLHPVPRGFVGQLYAAGVGVGQGYVNDPVRTAAAFLPDPYSDEPGARMYRTGDRVRLGPGGHIHVLGRVDRQVKIRGQRIEIGEIEQALAQQPEVCEGAVVVVEDQTWGKRLAAFVVASAPISVTTLAAGLRARLPAAMVPRTFDVLDALPLLDNGKLDRNALVARASMAPSPARSEPSGAPVDGLTTSLQAIWAEVLGTKVGLDDDFFELGGHSLAAVAILARARAELGLEIPVSMIFTRGSVRELVAKLAPLGGSVRSTPSSRRPLLRQAPRTLHELSPAQEPIWYMHELAPDSPLYNICFADMLLSGPLDRDALRAAWAAILARHPVMRVRFRPLDGRPLMSIVPVSPVDEAELFIAAPEGVKLEDQARVFAERFALAPIDLGGGPVCSLRVVSYSNDRHQLIFLVHHIVWDETSTMNLARELGELYNARREGREPELPALPIDYFDYVAWINGMLAAGELDAQRRYWRRALSPEPPPLELPTDRPRTSLQSFSGGEVAELMPTPLQARLQARLQTEGTTLFIHGLSVLAVLFHRLSGQQDFVVGAPIANRDDLALEPIMGLLAAALPLRCRPRPGQRFDELLAELGRTAVEAYDNHLYPSVLAIREACEGYDTSRNRLFSVMYGVQNNKSRLFEAMQLDGLEQSFIDGIRTAEARTARFDLTFVVDFVNERIQLRLNYNDQLFHESTARDLIARFFELTQHFVDDPSASIDAAPLLLPGELQARLHATTGPRWPRSDGTILERLSAVVSDAPERVALQQGSEALDYATLDRHAHAIASALVERGVEPEEPVVVAMGPGIPLVCTALGILRAGAAYFPLRTSEPAEVQSDLIERAGARRIVFDGSTCLPPTDGGASPIHWATLRDHPSKAPLPAPAPRHLAYLLYTSGSTGHGKGVMVEHRSLAHIIASTQAAYALGPDDRLLWTSAPYFDASILDLLWPLVAGARLVIPEQGHVIDPTAMAVELARSGATVAQTVPTVLAHLLQHGLAPDETLPRLRVLICGGEVLPPSLARECLKRLDARLVNHYGPTETTVDAARFACELPLPSGPVPIGQAIEATAIRVLDPQLRPVPAGVHGELWISGPGVARGYVGQPGLTAASFLPDPFGAAGERMYRSGDLGWADGAGRIHIAGRSDRQVQIRGNRVELDGIDHLLQRHPAVQLAHTRYTRTPGSSAERLISWVQLDDAVVRVGEDRWMFTLAQRPSLWSAMQSLHAEAWPAFFQANRSMRRYWPKLAARFAEYQFVLVDGADRTLAAGNALPIRWDGSIDDLPAGWDDGLRRGFEGERPDTLMGLAAVTDLDERARGLADELLDGFRRLARALGLERLVIPIRPTGHGRPEDMSFDQWCRARRDDGLPVDPWLRAHVRAGARVLRLAPRSQHMEAPLSDWESWAGCRFTRSGDYRIPGALQPICIDVNERRGEYWDPAVWVEHSVPTAVDYEHVGATELLGHMQRLAPVYMSPDAIRFELRMPIGPQGKIAVDALSDVDVHTNTPCAPTPPRTPTEQRLCRLWATLLELDEVGTEQDFFVLGGDSLTVVRMLARVRAEFGVRVRLRDFYLDRCVRALAARVDAQSPTS